MIQFNTFSPTMYMMCFVSVASSVISDVTVLPHDDRSLLVQWRSLVSSSLTGFVVEWRPLLETDLTLTQFEITDRNQTQFLTTGMFYSICIAGLKIHVLLVFYCTSSYFNFFWGFPNLVFILYLDDSLLYTAFFSLCTTCLYTLLGAYSH